MRKVVFLKQSNSHKNISIRNTLLALLICIFSIQNLYSQTSSFHKTYQTESVSGEFKSPNIDGIINEEVWNQVEWEGNFTQIQPNDGGEPSESTEFKIIYDSDYIYVAIRAFDSEPDLIVNRMARRDGESGDWVEVTFDSYFDKRSGYSFIASVSGVMSDYSISDDGAGWYPSWDPLWDFETSIDEEGWIAEIRIPFTQLRFNSEKEQIWGVQVIRHLFRKEERSAWRYRPREEGGWVRHFGELNGLNDIKPKRQVEISPYSVGKIERYQAVDGNPFLDGSDESISFGLDGKVGITNDLTLDFTVNPDFGQVEADPSEVNLTVFETFFEERRSFFIEGSNITSFDITGFFNPLSSDNLFYSRRIGRAPQTYPTLLDGEVNFVEIPDNTTILGAVKATGQTENGLSIGVIESLTSTEYANIYSDGNFEKQVVEPATNYFLGSVQKQTNNNNTILQGMITSTNRFIGGSAINLVDDAYTGGIELLQYWKDQKYYLRTNIIGSHLKGSPSAILEQQLSSRRYFQRPDNDYTSLDINRNTLSGFGGAIEFGRRGQSGLRYTGTFTWRSPGLELNDIGFMREADVLYQEFLIGYRFANPFSVFRWATMNYNQWAGWDYGMNKKYLGSEINFGMQFNNYWTLLGATGVEDDAISNTILRGGPSMKTVGNWNYWLSLQSDNRKDFTGSILFRRSVKFYDSGDSYSIGMNYSYRPTNAIRFTLNPGFQERFALLQYIKPVNYQNETRYIFGSIDQTTVNLTVRMDFTLSPNLTLQYYGSPFVSSVDYKDPKYITNPKAENLYDRFSEDVSFSNEDFESGYDFSFRQFRSNMVFRWEYRPGSLLYLVWAQGRTDFDLTADFSYRNDLNSLFSTEPQNIFLVKVSFLLGY